ncbi:MAG: Hsp20/alpha crystallin family protein [Candidatus Omnitrophica bacterium]|nr:Hsp20/alpha crystallin family protein [Candidatus Omnitrophota bacterium]
MKNKTLLIILAALCALLIFETGYLVGIGEQRKIFRNLRSRYIYPPQPFNPNWSFPRMQTEKLPVQAEKEPFFVTTMTSKNTDQAKIIAVKLPGVDKKDISVEVNGPYLAVQARQKKEAGISRDDFSAQTLNSSGFVQVIALGDNADTQHIQAEFSKDTLTITIPKDKRSKPSGKTFTVPIK